MTATYVVVAGDDLIAIGERFDMSVDALKARNKLPSNEIKVGVSWPSAMLMHKQKVPGKP